MYKKRKLFTLLILPIFHGCTNDNRTCKSFHEKIVPLSENKEEVQTINNCTGKILQAQEIKRITKDSIIYTGYYKEFHPSGKLKVLCFLKQGILDSTALGYDANGSIEFKTYYVNGEKRGFQDVYYPNGFLKQKNYHKNDSAIIFRIDYNKDGSIKSISGQTLRIDINKPADAYRIGDTLVITNEVIVLDNMYTALDVKLSSSDKKDILKKTYSDFVFKDNRHLKYLVSPIGEKGNFRYSAIASLYDKKHNGNLLKKDTITFNITIR